jgi:hypothetical protein
MRDADVMTEVIRTVDEGVQADGAVKRPNLTFVNLPTIDSAGHASGTQSGAYDTAIGLADTELQRFVENQKAKGLWERTVMFVVSDHSMDTTLSSRPSLRATFNLAGIPDGDVLVVQNGSVDMVYLADRNRPDRDAFLARLRAAALTAPGVDEALYRLPNPADGGAAHTLTGAHPGWRIAGPRTGDLLVTQLEGGAFNEPNPLVGNHGSPRTTDNTFAIIAGGNQVRQQAVGGVVGPRFDDTLQNPGSAQNVDVAPTVMALLGRAAPQHSEGRVLAEAFEPGVLPGAPTIQPARRLLTLARVTRRFGRRAPLRVRFRVSRAATVTIDVRRGKRRVRRVRVRVSRPSAIYRLRFTPRRLKRKGRYTIRITARAGGVTARSTRTTVRR